MPTERRCAWCGERPCLLGDSERCQSSATNKVALEPGVFKALAQFQAGDVDAAMSDAGDTDG
jgi:hypothetical protein